jgi:hypothetical protein
MHHADHVLRVHCLRNWTETTQLKWDLRMMIGDAAHNNVVRWSSLFTFIDICYEAKTTANHSQSWNNIGNYGMLAATCNPDAHGFLNKTVDHLRPVYFGACVPVGMLHVPVRMVPFHRRLAHPRHSSTSMWTPSTYHLCPLHTLDTIPSPYAHPLRNPTSLWVDTFHGSPLALRLPFNCVSNVVC